MNEYDSAKMREVMAETGVEATNQMDAADIIVFNTCSVRERAQEKVFSDLGRARARKADNPHIRIGVGGCVASQEGEEILRRAPYVDVVFGPQTLHRLPDLLDAREKTGQPQVDISFPEIEKFDALPQPHRDSTGTSPATAFVSIMEGCSKYCSFCVVPYTRGEEVSRPLLGVVDEVAALVDAGVREVTLLGQNVNAYRTTHNGMAVDFADLLACLSDIDGLARIRFTTSHPIEFGERLIDAFATLPKLPDYVHLPVQSGSDRVLAAMKRGYTALEYKSIIRRLRRARPDIFVSSDFIIGFPGESERDFEQTLALIDAVGFDFSFSFLYSPRPGTPAASLPDDTPLAVKKERLAAVQARLEANGKRLSEQMVGSVQEVLVEGHAKRGAALYGRCSNYRVVNFTGTSALIGQIIPVQITAAAEHSLRGRWMAKQEEGTSADVAYG